MNNTAQADHRMSLMKMQVPEILDAQASSSFAAVRVRRGRANHDADGQHDVAEDVAHDARAAHEELGREQDIRVHGVLHGASG